MTWRLVRLLSVILCCIGFSDAALAQTPAGIASLTLLGNPADAGRVMTQVCLLKAYVHFENGLVLSMVPTATPVAPFPVTLLYKCPSAEILKPVNASVYRNSSDMETDPGLARVYNASEVHQAVSALQNELVRQLGLINDMANQLEKLKVGGASIPVGK